MDKVTIDDLLDEYINNLKQNHPYYINKQRILEKERVIAEKQKEINELEEEISNLSKNPQSLSRIDKIFKTKRYKNAKDIANLKIRLNELKSELEIESRSKEICELQDDPHNYGGLDKLEELIQDRRKAILDMCQSDSRYGKSIEFMKRAIEINPYVIEFDKSNDPQLYLKYIDLILGDTESIEQDLMSNQYFGNIIIKAKEEILNPSQVNEGMYKVPHKYLFEALRIGAHLCNNKNTPITWKDIVGEFGLNNALGAADNLVAYFDLDGKISEEQGREFEKLYEGENYIFQHMYEKKEGSGKFIDSCIYGKRESGEQLKMKKLEFTFTGPYFNTVGFCGIFCPDKRNRIIASIPKKAFESGSLIPIWGNDDEKVSFLLPEYIIGMIPGNYYSPGDFIPSSSIIEPQRRHKYKYLYDVNGNNITGKENPLEDEK